MIEIFRTPTNGRMISGADQVNSSQRLTTRKKEGAQKDYNGHFTPKQGYFFVPLDTNPKATKTRWRDLFHNL